MNTYCRMTSPIQAELASGTSASAHATAFKTKSFTDSLAALSFSPNVLLKTSRSLKTLSMLMSRVR